MAALTPNDPDQTGLARTRRKWDGDTLVIDTVGFKRWMMDATHDYQSNRLRSQRHSFT